MEMVNYDDEYTNVSRTVCVCVCVRITCISDNIIKSDSA